MRNIKIKRYKQIYLNDLIALHHDTVHTVCKGHYTQKELDAWAPEKPDIGIWLASFIDNIAYVAVCDGRIVGFCDMTYDGFVNRLYTHKDYQNMGIGRMLMEKIEKNARSLKIREISLDASKAGLGFYKRIGFRLIRTQTKILRGVSFENYAMKKELL